MTVRRSFEHHPFVQQGPKAPLESRLVPVEKIAAELIDHDEHHQSRLDSLRRRGGRGSRARGDRGERHGEKTGKGAHEGWRKTGPERIAEGTVR
jgi:hypothetical protein